MSDQTFIKAYARVRGRHTNRTWQNLSAREVTDEIYKEIHLIDQQAASAADAVVEPLPLAAE